MTAQVGFVLELLEIVSVAARVEPPIDISRIVSRRVLAVFGELDGEAMLGAAVQAVPEAFHYHARPQFEILDSHQHLGIDERILPRPGSGRCVMVLPAHGERR